MKTVLVSQELISARIINIFRVKCSKCSLFLKLSTGWLIVQIGPYQKMIARKIVSEMTYNVSSGTLNPTIPYLRGYFFGTSYIFKHVV